ncbi:flagellar protein FlgN [Glaciihabitans sp. dw_435]|uniref:flagellar protein FlgN n=1 Tax=Glaciihabitans sp. dw_435 TaxID=2720081 RepID=UPI001BD5FD3B|nr:flagellar protein FlgN [Glaciihabitans sp. dw_435]
MGMHELSALLWKERELLEVLLFKLEVEQLLLTAGKTRWLERATKETEQVTARLRDLGLARTVEVAAVAAELGVSEDATLREVVAASPEGVWSEILQSHLRGLGGLVGRIQEVRDQNVVLLRSANRATQETLANVATSGGTYDANGVSSTGAVPDQARLLDKEV